MSHAVKVSGELSSLRHRAVTKLTDGTRPNPQRASASDALAALYQMASVPETAADALALLHELQVHQVELDLQQEELRRSRSELEDALIRQVALVERAPAGYMSVDATSLLYEINPAGTRLLGAAREDLLGRTLNGFLAGPSVGRLQTMLARARDGLVPETCELRLQPLVGVRCVVHAAVEADTTPGLFLLVLMAAASPDQAEAAPPH